MGNARKPPQRDLELRCYPRDDLDFRDSVQIALAESRELVRRSQQLIDIVQARLRERYPNSRIRARDRLAALDDMGDVWYCYRDGSLVA